MARKTRRAGGGASISDAGAGEEQQQQQPQDTPAPEPVQQQQAEEAVEDLSPDRLRDELRAARAEIARLKAELAAAGQGDDVPRKAAAAAGALKPPHEVAELQERLQQLRKEQQAADAARDKAWKQLKVRRAPWLRARRPPKVAGSSVVLAMSGCRKPAARVASPACACCCWLLQAVVEEISSLAQPEYLQSLQVKAHD